MLEIMELSVSIASISIDIEPLYLERFCLALMNSLMAEGSYGLAKDRKVNSKLINHSYMD